MIISIPKLFGTVVEKVGNKMLARLVDPFPVYYDYGRYKEIERRLSDKGKSVAGKNRKFPLVWLVMPFTEYNNVPTEGYTVLRNVDIVISTLTDPNSNTPDRMTKNFEGVLYPIYEELLKQMSISGFFSEIGYNVPHQKIDQPYWDGKDGLTPGGKNLYEDYIDAIQIKGLEVTVNQSLCSRFKLIG